VRVPKPALSSRVKNDVGRAFNRVLKAGDLSALDTLCAFTQPQDWGKAVPPFLALQRTLMDHTGSLLGLKRHARRAADHRCISFSREQNGKRMGHKTRTVYSEQCLTYPPSRACVELKTLYAGLQAERALLPAS